MQPSVAGFTHSHQVVITQGLVPVFLQFYNVMYHRCLCLSAYLAHVVGFVEDFQPFTLPRCALVKRLGILVPVLLIVPLVSLWRSLLVLSIML